MANLIGLIDESKGVRTPYHIGQARISAHHAFDKLWNSTTASFSRSVAYKWLSAKLGIPASKCHMKNMDVDTCNQVIMVCEEYRKTIGKWSNK